MAKSQCTACFEIFASGSAFNMHRVGSFGEAIYDEKRKHVIGYTKSERRCLSKQEMIDKDMIKNDKGFWTTGAFDASVFRKGETDVIPAT